MRRDELAEIQFIAPIQNVPPILERGILSHVGAQRVPHVSVADDTVLGMRENRVIPPGNRRLFDYANLYLCARNPMLFRLIQGAEPLCVLQISADVLDVEGAIITDGNAASAYTRFRSSPEGIVAIDGDRVFAEYWANHADQREVWRHKSQKCSEVLVPDRVPPDMILGARVADQGGQDTLARVAPALTVTMDAHLFFR